MESKAVQWLCSVLVNSEGHVVPSKGDFRIFHDPSVCPPHDHRTRTQRTHNPKKINSGGTHTRELDATVTALGSSALLLQVKVSELTTGGLDDANLVGPRVVPVGENSSICRSKIMKLVSIVHIQVESSVEEAFLEEREFFQRTGSGGAGEKGQHSAKMVDLVAIALTKVNLLLGILTVVNLGGQGRCRRRVVNGKMFELRGFVWVSL